MTRRASPLFIGLLLCLFTGPVQAAPNSGEARLQPEHFSISAPSDPDLAASKPGTRTPVNPSQARITSEWPHIWQTHRDWAVATLALGLLLFVTLLWLGLLNRRFKHKAEQYRQLVDVWPQPMLLMDEGLFTRANSAAAELLGYRHPADLVGKHPIDISPERQPDGQSSITRTQEIFEAVVAGQVQRFEWMHLKADGTPICLDVALAPTRMGGSTSLLCAWHDISEAKRIQQQLRDSESKFRSFFEKNSSVMLLIDPDSGGIVSANAAAADFYGYPLDRLLQMHIDDINTLTSRQVAKLRHLAFDENRKQFHFRHQLASGEKRDVEVYSTPLTTQGRHLLFSIIHDVTERVRAERSLRETQSRLHIFLEHFPGAVMIETPDRHILLTNQSYCDLFEIPITPEQLVGSDSRVGSAPTSELFADPERVVARVDALVDHKQSSHGDILEMRDGRMLECDYVPVREGDHFFGHVWLFRDITQRKRTEERLELAANVFTHAREGIMVTDDRARIIDVNKTFTHITGYTRDEVLGQSPGILSSGRQSAAFYATMWHELTRKGHWYGEIWNRRKNGELYAEMLSISAVRDKEQRIRQYVALFSDITLQKEHQKQLEHIAHYDALTGLLNRVLLGDRLHQAMKQADRHQQLLAVVFLDLDGFKEVNDGHGHEVGDQLLIAVATRLRNNLREEDTVARLGGDEFIVVLADLASTDASIPMLSRLLSATSQPVHIEGAMLQVSASLGVTFYPQGDEDVDADQLLRQADQAMYQAKLAGKNRYHVFDPDLDRSVRGHLESLEHIRHALSADELVMHYQPKVNMRTGEVVGAEALLRWQHPERGLLSPGAFLPTIEESPLAITLGEWVFKTVLQQMESWHADGLHLPISINVGSRQLQQSDFVGYLHKALAEHPNVHPENLELEVLESSALEDIVQVSRVINQCRELGVNFALDDFGTGYSSLTYLKHLPASALKIDQSFVHDMLDDPEDLAILEGIIGLASAFRREVIAEGVEIDAHGEVLLKLGCELAQGFGIARPMPAADLAGWVENWDGNPNWQGIPAVSRDDQAVLYAAVEHRAWILAIQKYLRGERDMPPTMNHHQCRFGQWLEGDGRRRHGQQPAFKAIFPLHRKVHATATELLQRHLKGDAAGAEKGLDDLLALRDEMQRHLDTLIRQATDRKHAS